MSKAMVSTALWWLVESSVQQLVEATNNSTDDGNSGIDLSAGKIAIITIGSLAGVALLSLTIAGCASCCIKKITKVTISKPDGSKQINETEERGSQEVADKIVGVAQSAVTGIEDVFALVTHSTTTTTTKPLPNQNSTLLPSQQQPNYGSTSETRVDVSAVLVAVKADLANGPSDGNTIAARGLSLIQDQLALDEASLLIAQSAASPPPAALVQQTTIDIHAEATHVIPATSGSAATVQQSTTDIHTEAVHVIGADTAHT